MVRVMEKEPVRPTPCAMLADLSAQFRITPLVDQHDVGAVESRDYRGCFRVAARTPQLWTLLRKGIQRSLALLGHQVLERPPVLGFVTQDQSATRKRCFED